MPMAEPKSAASFPSAGPSLTEVENVFGELLMENVSFWASMPETLN